MVNVFNEGLCGEFWRKKQQLWFTYFQIAGKYYKSF